MTVFQTGCMQRSNVIRKFPLWFPFATLKLTENGSKGKANYKMSHFLLEWVYYVFQY